MNDFFEEQNKNLVELFYYFSDKIFIFLVEILFFLVENFFFSVRFNMIIISH